MEAAIKHTGNNGNYPVFSGTDDGNHVEICGGKTTCTIYINGVEIHQQFNSIPEAITHLKDVGSTEIYRSLFHNRKLAEDVLKRELTTDSELRYEILPEKDGRGNTHSLTLTCDEDVLHIAAYPSEKQARHDIAVLGEQFCNIKQA